MRPRTIVAEVSKNWNPGIGSPYREDGELVSQKFEDVIATNEERGYRLKSWQLVSTFTHSDYGSSVNETIVAVFELQGRAAREEIKEEILAAMAKSKSD